MNYILSVDPSRTRAYGALWRDGCVVRVAALSGYESGYDRFDPNQPLALFVTEQVTVFGGAANARALIQVAYDAGLRAGPYAARGVPCVALTPSEWRSALGVQGAHKTRAKRAVDADVREVVLRDVPGAEAALAPFKGSRGALPQDAFDAIAIGLAAERMRTRLGHEAFAEHHAMPRDLSKSRAALEPEAQLAPMLAGAVLESRRDLVAEAKAAYEDGQARNWAELNSGLVARLDDRTLRRVIAALRGES
jgi:hypothetical protein